RIERRVVQVDAVAVAAGGVRLPDLDQLSAKRLPVRAEQTPRHDDPLAEWLACVLAGQVVVELADPALAVDGPGHLGERVRQDDERLLWMPEPRPDVVRVVVRRICA